MPRIRTYPELSLAALNAREDKELRVWYLLRYLDKTGTGRVALQALQEFVTQRRLFSPETLRRALKRGRGAYWETRLVGSETMLFYEGVRKVSARLAVTPRHAVDIELDNFRSIARLRQALIASYLATGKSGRMTISQTNLAEKVSRTRRTVNSYLKSTKRQRNAIRSTRTPDSLTTEMLQSGWYRSVCGGEHIACRLLPSTYSSGLVARRYRLRRHGSSHMRRGARRVFYFDARALAGELQGMREGEVVFADREDSDCFGTRLWNGYQRVGGTILDL